MDLNDEELTQLFNPWIGKTTEVNYALGQADLAEDGKAIYRLNKYTKAEFHASSNIVFLSNKDIIDQEIGLQFFLGAIKTQDPEPAPAPTKKRCTLQ